MTRDLLLLSLALQRHVLLVRKSGGCLKAEEIKEEGNRGCFQQSQGLAVQSSKDWLLSPVAEELKKSDVQIRMQKVEILSIVSDHIPGNMHALFHLILTFGSESDFTNPSQGVCPCPNSLFLLVHFSAQIWTVWAILPALHRLCLYVKLDVWTDTRCNRVFSLGFILAWMTFLWYVQPHKQQCCLSCTGTWVTVSSRGKKGERKIYCSWSAVHGNPY